MFSFSTSNPQETRAFGETLGNLLQPGDVVCLVGDLGAGKTTLVQGIAAGWGSDDQVTSPTFVLINEYRHPTGKRLYHMDAYRLSGPAEALDLDIDSLMEESPLVVEWADRISAALPEACVQILIDIPDDQNRNFKITLPNASGRLKTAIQTYLSAE